MDINFVGIVLRWLHILPAALIIGGTIYILRVVLPSLDGLPDDTRRQLVEAMRARWAKLFGVSAGLLLISGISNVMSISRQYDLPAYYHPLFGIKFLLALAVFYLGSMLSGRSESARRMQQNSRFWVSITAGLILAVVLISGVLRMAERSPKAEQPEPETTGQLEAAPGSQILFDAATSAA